NLKFNEAGLDEVRRKFFGTLYNTYSFFVLYANIDKFTYSEPEIELQQRPEIDQWILSLLNSLSEEVDQYYADFEPTKAARAIQSFVDENLSNWYVRLCRRRFWKGDYSQDKISAYQTLYTCLTTVAKLMSPIAPFFSDRLFLDLNLVTGKERAESVHLVNYPETDKSLINKDLEERMSLAQDISSMVLSLRKKTSINVRQPLNKILLPVLDDSFIEKTEKVKDLILSETNIKNIEYIKNAEGIIRKKIKPNFKSLGPKVGKDMKAVGAAIMELTDREIQELEENKTFTLSGSNYAIGLEDVEIIAEDVEGWQVANLGRLTVALDIQISPVLKQEGIAREFVNRIQNLRENLGLEVTDKITVNINCENEIGEAVKNNLDYISSEILAEDIIFKNDLAIGEEVIIEDQKVRIS